MRTVERSHPELLGVHIRRYKNLVDQWIPWSPGVAFFGANGAGKTNVLEALCLLTGRPDTLLRARERIIAPAAGELRMFCRGTPRGLPWTWAAVEQVGYPSNPAGSPLLGAGLERPDLWGRISPATHDLISERCPDLAWWSELSGSSPFGEYLAYFVEQLRDPVIEYELAEFAVLGSDWDEFSDEPSDEYDEEFPEEFPADAAQSWSVHRRYTRTWWCADVPEELTQAVQDLPGPFRPLLRQEAVGPEGYRPVLVLPEVYEPPLWTEWIAAERHPEEIGRTFRDAYDMAVEQAQRLAGHLGAIAAPVDDATSEVDVHGWVSAVAEQAAAAELASTLPHVGVVPGNGKTLGFRVRSGGAGDSLRVTVGDEATALVHCSAAERRWIDEAAGTATRALDRFAGRAQWQADFLDTLDEEVTQAALDAALASLGVVTRAEGFSTQEVVAVLEHLDVALLKAAWGSAADDPILGLHEASVLAPGLVPDWTVRVFDEPEAHLHPAAQHAMTRALAGLCRIGDNVVVATHSPRFLNMAGFAVIHVRRTAAGTVIDPLADRDRRSAWQTIADDLDCNRGELLTLVSYVLLLEGEHDRFVLDTFYRQQLAEAGVALLCLRGIKNLPTAAELDFIERYLHVPIGLMLDNTQLLRVKDRGVPESLLTVEERELRNLMTKARNRVKPFGLSAPDVIAYLPESAIPGFPPDLTWTEVLERYRTVRGRSFKPWLFDTYGIELRHLPQIKEAVFRTRGRKLPLGAELVRIVERVLAEAAAPS
jgi:hypothetical protein